MGSRGGGGGGGGGGGAAAAAAKRRPYVIPDSSSDGDGDGDGDGEGYSRSSFVSKLRMARSESQSAMEASQGMPRDDSASRSPSPDNKTIPLEVGMGNEGENDGFRSPALSPTRGKAKRATIDTSLVYNQAQMTKKEEMERHLEALGTDEDGQPLTPQTVFKSKTGLEDVCT